MSSSQMAAQADLSQRFALDTQGFEALKQNARTGASDSTLRTAARQFEAVFTQMMLKSMRDATPQDGMFDNEQTKLYMSMMDQQLSQQLSSRGIGLADVMMRQLARANGSGLPPELAGGAGSAAAKAASGLQAGMDEAAPGLARVLDMRNGDADTPRVGSVVAGANWNPTAGLRQYQAQDAGAWQGGNGALPEDTPAHISAFISRMAGPAQSAARATGVPARLILGQAALESGWGRREITNPDGSTTFNVFGIKAGPGWKGQVAEVTTTEYVDGQPQKVRARFRAYGSYDEAFADYGRLLSNNPRYAPVLAAATPDEAARGLQRAGYATDPAYGEKLVRIMRKVPV
ncbi:flagellar assembly peptidoglycan hydrolase FlgJ [Cupriavidus basilensis]|uniref:flagellar assembly peptidoglycan hydrolase FlgJ n=1 Tax=Cupriavidus basilensis TaxID=68895 RepID=UPI0020A63CE4|nr:flagellar assembly peptidoglycan hydrolase FlgJ [Cupriavidus basilensis]MCP3021683.1 flagellar assembly peptidoglycan hydrolase FlgJ [Cupriavidus basilensis]MDR3452561.1 flagellar assembly peptidoglycan hydrolase FlgJ [Rhodoferax sp.]